MLGPQFVPRFCVPSKGRRKCVATKAARRRQGGPDGASSPPPATPDEQLIRELNSSHLWLPGEDCEFGLDDVEAHVNSRNQGLDFSGRQQQQQQQAPGRSSSSARRARPGRRVPGGGAASLSELDPDPAHSPPWLQQLQRDGFDVRGRSGQLFLQRAQQQPPQTQSQQKERPQQPVQQQHSNPSRRQSSNQQVQPERTSQRPPAAAAAGGHVSDSSLAIRSEFDPLVWQQQAAADDNQDSSSLAPATDAWYSSGSSSTVNRAGTRAPASSSKSSSSSSSSPSASPAPVRLNVQKQLLGFRQPERLLAFVESSFPAWSANGCWLVDQQQQGLVAAPTPAEAAAALKGTALAAKRAGLTALQVQGLARDRRVRGLVECLRLTAPRAAPHQPADLSQRLWSIARAYWRQAGATATAAQQQLLTAVAAAATAQGKQAPAQLRADRLSGQQPLGSLLAELSSAGVTLDRQQLAAAQALLRGRQDDGLRQQAFVSGLWGLSVIGGPLFFQAEVEALCQVAALDRWRLRSAEVSDVLWALANARHWAPLLPQLEAALIAAGGVPAATAPELVTALWAFATLAHPPQQLLAQLDAAGWAVKPLSQTPAAQHSKQTPAAPRKGKQQKHQKQRQKQQTVAAGQTNTSCQLSELNGSQLTSLAWSLACLQCVRGQLFRQVWAEVCRRGPALAGDVRQLVRVQQAALAVTLEADYRPTDLFCDAGTLELLDSAARAFQATSNSLQDKVHSTYQRSIATTLTRMRVMHVMEDTSTGYSVDISVPALRLAIEADGPSHISRTAGGSGKVQTAVQLGATAMKRRHLQGLGWSVLNLTYTDWDALQGDEQRMRFLQQHMDAAAAASRAGQRGL